MIVTTGIFPGHFFLVSKFLELSLLRTESQETCLPSSGGERVLVGSGTLVMAIVSEAHRFGNVFFL